MTAVTLLTGNQQVISDLQIKFSELQEFILTNENAEEIKLQIAELQNYTELEHLTLVGRSAQEIEKRRYFSGNHAEAINQKLKSLKLSQKLTSGVFNYTQVKNICKEKRSPVEVGSMITGSGHIILYIGNNKWHDSYGKCSEKTLAYNGEGFNTNGAKVEYSEKFVLERINEIPFITVASVTTGKFNIFCKIRAKDTKHAKEVIFMIDDIEGVYRTETMISLEESINDKKRLMHTIFKNM
jgi:hypothetical protein